MPLSWFLHGLGVTAKDHRTLPLWNARGGRATANAVATHETTFRVTHHVVLGIQMWRFALVLLLARPRIGVGQNRAQHPKQRVAVGTGRRSLQLSRRRLI